MKEGFDFNRGRLDTSQHPFVEEHTKIFVLQHVIMK